MKRILIVNVNWLGDVLFTTPIFKALKKKYPESYVACMIPPRCKDILEGNSNLDEIILFDERSTQRSLIAKIKFISLLRQKKFDTVFLLHRSFTRALITYLAGIPQRIGYFTKKRKILLTQSVAAPDINKVHRLDYYARLFESQGIEVKDITLEIFISESDERFAKDLLQSNNLSANDFVVAINPGGNWNLKRWPKENFAKLADALIKEFNAKIIINGGSEDISLANEIDKLMEEKPIIICGETNLKQLAAIFKKVNLVISADSGPMHIANAVGTKLIALFGPTDPKITGPYHPHNCVIIKTDIDCDIPCYDLDCEDNKCMRTITPKMVFEEVKKILRI